MIESLWYGSSSAAAAGRAALRPLSLLFGAAVDLRTLLYDRGLLAVRRAPAPVVSVGALIVGGAGKTPFVAWLAGRLVAAGLTPCIVTRGYRRAGTDDSTFLIDPGFTGSGAALGDLVRSGGDEAAMLALRTGVGVAVGRDRAEACEEAMLAWSPDLFLLDDGFQHRALARDLDIVLVTGDEGGWARLPAGPLREKPSALARADVVVTTENDFPVRGGSADPLRLRCRMRPSLLVTAVDDREGEAPSVLRGMRVVAVAGVARPTRFLAALGDCGARIVSTILRRDHHHYVEADAREIAAATAHADLLVTTEKDLVKLGGLSLGLRPYALRVEIDVEGESLLLDRIDALARFDRSALRTQYPPSSGGRFSS